MQLDKTYIAIRERDFLEILDLSLHVILRFLAPLGLALLVGVVPLAVLSHYWFFDVAELEPDLIWGLWYTSAICAFAALLSPVATAPATLFLGQALFMEKPSPQRIAKDFFRSLPQLLTLQVVGRGLMMAMVATIFVPFTFWPYLGEIILLERNPLFQGKSRRITTTARVGSLHGGNGGELFSRWMGALTIAFFVGAMITLALWAVHQWVDGTFEINRWPYAMFVQIAVWTVVSYFAVVRFSYLDLRIRREGWEVELKMRAEAARLQSELV